MTFREKLVRLRKLKDLTQDEFASAVGVSRQAVYKWESGQSYPEVPKLLEIKMLFGISIDDLLDDTYEVEMPEKKRRKRIAKADKERIEKEVLAQENAINNGTDDNTVSTVVPGEEPVSDVSVVKEPENAEAAEPEATEAAPEEPTTENSEATPAAVAAEEPLNEEPAVPDYEEPATLTYSSAPEIDVEEAEPDNKNQKKGFFARLFSKK